MAAMARLQFSLIPKPSTIYSPVFSNTNSLFHRTGGLRKLSLTPSLSSISDPIPKGSSTTASNSSIVGDLLDYLNESWTQFHATAEAKRQLIAAGFCLLSEKDEWDLKPGGRYFFTRNMSCLVAFAIGEHFSGTLVAMVFM